MSEMDHKLNPDLFSKDVEQEAMRQGFGRGLLGVGKDNEQIVALAADLTDSTQLRAFADEFPDRFVQVGIAEQNLVTIASGMAHVGKIPFCASYAAFSPGRNWEQIKTTICLNNQPVKIVGSHAGVNVGPDGATHQMLEDIALMRVLPNMVVIAPGDAVEAEKAVAAMVGSDQPNYLRLARDKSPILFAAGEESDWEFEIGKAYILRGGEDITLLGTGTMTYHLLIAAKELESQGVSAEVVHVPTIKPLDESTIVNSVKKCGRALVAEEAQIAAGLGGAVAELLSEKLPTPLKRVGMNDRFGESGEPSELLEAFGLTGKHIADVAKDFIDNTPKYHQDQ